MKFQASVSLLVIALIVTSVSAQHQISIQSVCPRISVSLSKGTESQLLFRTIVSETIPEQKFSYAWSVYNAHIISGQGTPAIALEGFDAVTATVEVKGAPTE